MIEQLKKSDASKRDFIANIENKNIEILKISEFMTEKSMNFFKIIGYETLFLNKDPIMWFDDETCIKCREVCSKLQVVNDVAERAVATSQEFYGKLTKDTDEWQRLLLNVTDRRKKKVEIKNRLKINFELFFFMYFSLLVC